MANSPIRSARSSMAPWLELGAGMHLIDPTEAREHETALSTFDENKKVVIDAKNPRFSLDGLRIFPFGEAAERTVDHLLPQLGYASVSPQAARLKGLFKDVEPIEITGSINLFSRAD